MRLLVSIWNDSDEIWWKLRKKCSKAKNGKNEPSLKNRALNRVVIATLAKKWEYEFTRLEIERDWIVLKSRLWFRIIKITLTIIENSLEISVRNLWRLIKIVARPEMRENKSNKRENSQKKNDWCSFDMVLNFWENSEYNYIFSYYQIFEYIIQLYNCFNFFLWMEKRWECFFFTVVFLPCHDKKNYQKKKNQNNNQKKKSKFHIQFDFTKLIRFWVFLNFFYRFKKFLFFSSKGRKNE